MINWKYKDKYYYFDHMTAIQIIGFLYWFLWWSTGQKV